MPKVQNSKTKQPRRTNKPPVVQAAVAAKRLAGDSKAKIARDLGLHRETVRVILDDAELDTLVKRGRSGVRQLIDKAVHVYDVHLDSLNHTVATRVLEGTGVLETSADRPAVTNSIKLVILNANNRPPRIPPSDNGHEPTNGDSSIQ